MADQLTNVNFDLIRYANCWEDADVLLAGLQARQGSRILSIASAGDNSFSLLTTDPELVVAVDLSRIQLNLVELKRAAIEQFDRSAYLQFMGFEPSDVRLKAYRQVRDKLSESAKAYWDHHKSLIEKGLIHQGKFEKYFRLFASKILPLIHSQRRVQGLFLQKSASDQQIFYQNQWNSVRWRLLFKIFFSKMVMGRVGRDPEFLKQVNIPVSQYIFQMAERELSHPKAQENYFLYYTLTGRYGHGLPHYVREGNYEKVQQNLQRLELHEGLAEDALEKYPGITHMNLSDIFEYMEEALFQEVAQKLHQKSAPSCKIAYWNLMVPRELSEALPQSFKQDTRLSQELSEIDKGFFYRKFIIDQKS